MQVPVTITKAELKRALGITNDKRWRNKIMTDAVITSVLEMSVDEFRRLHEFDVLRTRKLIEFFSIPPDRFQ